MCETIFEKLTQKWHFRPKFGYFLKSIGYRFTQKKTYQIDLTDGQKIYSILNMNTFKKNYSDTIRIAEKPIRYSIR